MGWNEVMKADDQLDPKQIPMIIKNIAENLAKIRTVNVMAPACTVFVKQSFFELHRAFRQAKLIPPEEVIEGLKAPSSGLVKAELKLTGSTAAQDDAEKRGRKRNP